MNIKMDKNAAELIIDSVGNDSFKLKNELAKAKTYLSAERSDSNTQLFLKSNDVKKIFSDPEVTRLPSSMGSLGSLGDWVP